MSDPDQPMRTDPSAGQGDDSLSVTRSEEELRITTRRRATQRVRLRKRVITEMVTRTVPVRREEVSIEYVPITGDDDDGRSVPGPEDPDRRWMVLFEEEVILQTRRVARERVRLVTRTITEDREISEVLAKERVEIDHDDRSR